MFASARGEQWPTSATPGAAVPCGTAHLHCPLADASAPVATDTLQQHSQTRPFHHPKETYMSENPNELTIENSVLVLIDHQQAIALAVHSIDHGVLIDNVAGLARAAKDLGVPTVLTTIGAQGSVLVDPIFKEISEVFPEITPIDRTSTHAWSHPKVQAAVDATGRKKLIMAGLATEVCLAQSALAALRDGFDVYFVSDCSAGRHQEGHEAAKV